MSFYSKYSGSEIESVLDSVPNKQEMLIEGKGININDNVISCTLDTTLYKVVQNLPETGEENKIYLIQSNGGVHKIFIRNTLSLIMNGRFWENIEQKLI